MGVVQLVRAPDCGSGGRGFEPLLPPLKKVPATQSVAGISTSQSSFSWHGFPKGRTKNRRRTDEEMPKRTPAIHLPFPHHLPTTPLAFTCRILRKKPPLCSVFHLLNHPFSTKLRHYRGLIFSIMQKIFQEKRKNILSVRKKFVLLHPLSRGKATKTVR